MNSFFSTFFQLSFIFSLPLIYIANWKTRFARKRHVRGHEPSTLTRTIRLNRGMCQKLQGKTKENLLELRFFIASIIPVRRAYSATTATARPVHSFCIQVQARIAAVHAPTSHSEMTLTGLALEYRRTRSDADLNARQNVVKLGIASQSRIAGTWPRTDLNDL